MKWTRFFVSVFVLVSLLTLGGAAGAQEPQPAGEEGLSASSLLSSGCVAGGAYDPACDVNRDGRINIVDLQLAASHWSQTGVWTSDSWNLTGNAGTTPGTNFLGTTDNQDLVVKTNGAEAVRIGTNRQERLDVAGNVRISQVAGHSWAVGASADVTGQGTFFIEDLDAGQRRLQIDQNTGDVGVSGGGSFIVDFGAALGHLKLTTPGGSGPGVIAYAPNGNRRDIFFTNGGIRLSVSTSSSSAGTARGLAIDQGTANVGIGTTSPDRQLTVFRSGSAYQNVKDGTREILMGVDQNGGIVSVMTNHDLIFRAGGNSEKMRIAAGGNVGIGTTNPNAKLEASGTSGDLLRLTNPNSPTGPTVFRVDSSGQVFADATYNCGLSSSSACLQAGQGADVAERIDVSEPVEPGDIIEIDPGRPGQFRKARSAYSPLVVGIVSTAPAITLGNRFDAQADQWEDRRPLLALAGRVPAKVTTENGPIQVGDLLVSASKPGYAMRCADRAACVGTIVGKALEPLDKDTGLIQVSVSIQ